MSDVFPDQFLWGAATAAHQVEGGQDNDWTRWERTHADERAADAENRLQQGSRFFAGTPDWELVKQDATDPDTYVSGQACDHYHRYETDFDLAQSLNHSAHRFSVEWSRIEPEPGYVNEDAVQHYRDVARALRTRGMEPIVTLWHFTHPTWFADRGGWRSEDAVDRFTRYVETVVGALQDEVMYWLTLNEVQTYAVNAYLGERPPDGFSPRGYLQAVKTMIRAHQHAYHAIKNIDPAAQVGMTTNQGWHVPHQDRFINRVIVALYDRWWNDYVPRKVRGTSDFIGLNHYLRNEIHYGRNVTPATHTSDMGWALRPGSMYHVLHDTMKYGLPILITENGVADAQDAYRGWYLEQVLSHVMRARADGVSIHGYLHWSLLDNFEWDEGFWPRFGLIHVDYDTLERTVRPSAERYARLITEYSTALPRL